MAETVSWAEDGTPGSARFNDIYRSASGGLAQAQHVFLGGCGLPGAWAGQPQYTILEIGFGLGLNFLAAWQAWRSDPQRPRMLHFVSVEAWPVAAADITRSAGPWPELGPMAEQLANAWWGLLPGVHRLSFDDGRVTLTLAIGDVQPALRSLGCEADAVFLDGFAADHNPHMWSLETLQLVSRHCRRGTRLATWSTQPALREALAQLGFVVHRRRGPAPKRRALTAAFEPAWILRRQPVKRAPVQDAIVVGAGVAGAAVAASLARRGWQVQVIDLGTQPAAGASSLPVGLMVPHASPDDAVVSRASRSGVRATLEAAQRLLTGGRDWQPTGVLRRASQRGGARPLRLPPEWLAEQAEWASAWAAPHALGLWHSRSAWIKPRALVAAWLAQPGITWSGGVAVDHVAHDAASGRWQLLDGKGLRLADASLLIMCAASDTTRLVRPWADWSTDTVAGQVAWGPWPAELSAADGTPVSGQGHFIPAVPQAHGSIWLSGSTYERAALAELDTKAGLAANRERISHWLPHADSLQSQFDTGQVQTWVGERCTTQDRLPLVGAVSDKAPGLLVSTGMGSRGLTFATLCAELLAAQLHGEPLPIARRLAAALDAKRQSGSPKSGKKGS